MRVQFICTQQQVKSHITYTEDICIDIYKNIYKYYKYIQYVNIHNLEHTYDSTSICMFF